MRHFQEHSPDLAIAMVTSSNREMFLDCVREHKVDVYIINWDLLRIPKVNTKRQLFAYDLYRAIIGEPGTKAYQKRLWFHVIADEVHRAKNKDAQQARVLKQIRTLYRTALTGTPIANRPPDLWSILNWLYPKDFSSSQRWNARYGIWHEDYRGGAMSTTKYKIYDGPQRTDELQARIAPFVVQRGREVRPQLPPRHVDIHVDLSPQQRRAYDQMKKHMIAWVGEFGDQALVSSAVVTKLQRLQQLAIAHANVMMKPHKHHSDCAIGCAQEWDEHVQMTEPSSKLDALMELLGDNPDEQFVVFSQFRGTVQLLATRLEHAGIRYGQIIGGQPAASRASEISAFAAGESRIIIGTIAAGGEGIDGLQCASALVLIDRDWSPSRNDQSIGRLDRIGQQRDVVVYDIVARNTVDAYKGQLLNRKASWIRQILAT